MRTESDMQIAGLLQKAAEGSLSEDEFYECFRRWYSQTDASIKDIVFREVEHFWANFRFPKSPTNIIENDRTRLRLLARAIDEEWDSTRAQKEIDNY